MSQSNSLYVEFAQVLYTADEITAGQPNQIALILKRTGNLDGIDEVQIVPTDGKAEPWTDFLVDNTPFSSTQENQVNRSFLRFCLMPRWKGLNLLHLS